MNRFGLVLIFTLGLASSSWLIIPASELPDNAIGTETRVGILIKQVANSGMPDNIKKVDSIIAKNYMLELEKLKDRPMVLKTLQVIVKFAKSHSEKERFFAANALGYLSDDAQSIELMIDAATSPEASGDFSELMRKMIGQDEILTQAQGQKLGVDIVPESR